jgi:ubiquitin-protein ligase
VPCLVVVHRYAGGQFRLKIVLGDSFPSNPPKAFFLTKIFHPNVASNGAICVNTLKKDWKPTYGIEHVLTVIKCLLIHPNPASALNEEAGKLLLEQYVVMALLFVCIFVCLFIYLFLFVPVSLCL